MLEQTPTTPKRRFTFWGPRPGPQPDADGHDRHQQQLQQIQATLERLLADDFSTRVPLDGMGGIVRDIGESVNAIIDRNRAIAQELVRISTQVAENGEVTERLSTAEFPAGPWENSLKSVNGLIDRLARPIQDVIRVIDAVADGDLSQRMDVQFEGKPLKGEFLRLSTAVNTVVDRLGAVTSEVNRVASEVGTEGILGGQAQVPAVSGTWKDLTDNVNLLAGNLTSQVRGIAQVATAIANGDLSQKIVVDAKGEILELKNTINVMVDQLNSFASEVTRVAREVGTEGKLGGQAQVRGVSGTWKGLTDNVNVMASNLTDQVRNIALVTTAVANGDLSQKITVDAKGEVLELKNTINVMVDQLNSFAAEVTRVAREVGTDGRLGGQAQVPGVSGTWKDLTDNVNLLAGNLTTQVRNIALVTTAIATGDLSQKITVEAKGEIAALADTINTTVDTLRAFAGEVIRVAREVGVEGKLGGQARVPGVSGTWKDLTDNVNLLAGNLTDQVRNIALVTTAVANGDLSQKITVDVQGEILQLKSTINVMVDQLRVFADQVTTVAREVGVEGKLGGQANVPGVSGTWKDLTDNVNLMAGNLTSQVRGIVKVVTAIATGDLSQKFVVEAKGEIAALADTINGMTDTLRVFADQVTSVAREVGVEGKLGGQARVPGVSGTWKDLTDNVNLLAGNLTTQVRNIALVTTAVANGDLSQKITVDVQGEILALKNTINTMVDQLRAFASEVTRVAREVGTEGKLGGQAEVQGVSGTWKDLTDNVNVMANNLTSQVRGIVKVVTAIANGDLSQKFVVEAKGEIAALADTINNMTDTLRVFADQVTSVAREVGIEGKLGGQAKVPGAAGTWKDLTDNVNQLAGNLTTQVRAISEVATAVTQGDLTRAISVEAQGEVQALKDTINQMITNLGDTTRKNKEQDWLKTNLAKFSGMMQGQRALGAVTKLLMSELTPLVSAQHGAFYVMENEDGDETLRLISTYAYSHRKSVSNAFKLGEGLVGQCALEKERILVTDVPDDYIHISSGLGEAPPRNILVLPVLFEEQTKGVIELASFQEFSPIHLTFLEQLMQSVGVVFNMISASMRTEELLLELQRSNVDLGARSSELEEKASELEAKNREIAKASASLEEKAKELGLVSKYKSEFLANMSHELRTPLNSLLILARILSTNEERTLTPKQVEYASTIYSAGTDLLALINEILDLSKIEAGQMRIETRSVALSDIRNFVESTFAQVAEQKGIAFQVTVDEAAPATMVTDQQRLQQILKNLLSNAFKFTDHGHVRLSIGPASPEASFRMDHLNRAQGVLAFAVSDTGIGIPADKQQIIFEAFQQADASTSRTYGGTGLGLTISRDLARLLGGEIQLQSDPGEGSVFTLFLPMTIDEGDKGRSPEPPALQIPVEPETYEALSPSDAQALMTGKKILIVDDDARNLFAITSLLEGYGAVALCADNAQEAIELLESEPGINLVLMDIMMPGMDGYQATRRIRETDRFADLPIIALTAKAMPGDREKTMAAGLSDFIPKPVDSDRLMAVIQKWLT